MSYSTLQRPHNQWNDQHGFPFGLTPPHNPQCYPNYSATGHQSPMEAPQQQFANPQMPYQQFAPQPQLQNFTYGPVEHYQHLGFPQNPSLQPFPPHPMAMQQYPGSMYSPNSIPSPFMHYGGTPPYHQSQPTSFQSQPGMCPPTYPPNTQTVVQSTYQSTSTTYAADSPDALPSGSPAALPVFDSGIDINYHQSPPTPSASLTRQGAPVARQSPNQRSSPTGKSANQRFSPTGQPANQSPPTMRQSANQQSAPARRSPNQRSGLSHDFQRRCAELPPPTPQESAALDNAAQEQNRALAKVLQEVKQQDLTVKERPMSVGPPRIAGSERQSPQTSQPMRSPSPATRMPPTPGSRDVRSQQRQDPGQQATAEQYEEARGHAGAVVVSRGAAERAYEEALSRGISREEANKVRLNAAAQAYRDYRKARTSRLQTSLGRPGSPQGSPVAAQKGPGRPTSLEQAETKQIQVIDSVLQDINQIQESYNASKSSRGPGGRPQSPARTRRTPSPQPQQRHDLPLNQLLPTAISSCETQATEGSSSVSGMGGRTDSRSPSPQRSPPKGKSRSRDPNPQYGSRSQSASPDRQGSPARGKMASRETSPQRQRSRGASPQKEAYGSPTPEAYQQFKARIDGGSIVGETLFQLERKILAFVFNDRKRFYGFSVRAMDENLQYASWDDITKRINRNAEMKHQRRLEMVMEWLKPLGFDINSHGPLMQRLINEYGLIRDRRSVREIGTKENFIMKLISEVSLPQHKAQLEILAECLFVMAEKTESPNFVW